MSQEIERQGPSVAELQVAGEQLHRQLERAVLRMRLYGHSWARVGSVLGVSRQAASQRWRYLDNYSVTIRRSAEGGEVYAEAWCTQLGEVVELDQAAGRVRALSQLVWETSK